MKQHTEMTAQNVVTELRNEIAAIPCINSHSHICPEPERVAAPLDALRFFEHAYPRADLASAGMSPVEMALAFDSEKPLGERWAAFAPYWRWIQTTGYSQCILTGFRDLLGFSELTRDTVEPLSNALREFSKPGFYREVLQYRSGIERSIVNVEDLIEVDRDLFLPLPRLNRFSMLKSTDQISAIEQDYDIVIRNLSDLVELIAQVCKDWKRAGVAGVKMSQSYHRPMNFEQRQEEDACPVFASLMSGDYPGLDSKAGRVLEDYLVFACCHAASAVDLTIQFHQGIRAGNYGSLEGCSPSPLVPLMRKFPEVRFDLSHAGFPYLREGAVLAKTFPNVYLNMSWIHIISPCGSQLDLREWLEMVPYNKIIAFGDDLQHVEAVYGHLQMARQNFAEVLAEMTTTGRLSDSVVLDIANAAFHDNPAKIYGLKT